MSVRPESRDARQAARVRHGRTAARSPDAGSFMVLAYAGSEAGCRPQRQLLQLGLIGLADSRRQNRARQ